MSRESPLSLNARIALCAAMVVTVTTYLWLDRTAQQPFDHAQAASYAAGILALSAVFALVARNVAPRAPSDEQRERNRRARDRRLRAGIRRILMRDWDPLGVQEVCEDDDEYDDYLDSVVELLASAASERRIADHLARIEHEWMARPDVDRNHLGLVARKLRELADRA